MDDRRDIRRRVCRQLWQLASAEGPLSPLAPRLILPKYRSGDDRLSEQEARYVYTNVLNSTNFYYSVETLTVREY